MQRNTKWIAGSALALTLIGCGAGIAAAGDLVGGTGDTPLTGTTLEKATAAALAETGGGAVTDTEHDDDQYEIEVTLKDGTQVEITLDDTFSVVQSESDDNDAPLPGSILEQATTAALAETGGGTVTDTEQAPDGSYEVEVTRDDKSEVEVRLDRTFKVTGLETDADLDSDDDDGQDDSD